MSTTTTAACGCTLTSTGKPCARPADQCASEAHLIWRRAVAAQAQIVARQAEQAERRARAEQRKADQARVAAANPFAVFARERG